MRPETEADLAEAIRSSKGPLQIVGGGTRDIGRIVKGEPLSLAGLSGVTLYEPGALTLVARSGTPLSEIKALLASEGQRLAFEPYDTRIMLGTTGETTIGGVVATNASGSRRFVAGACRDHLIGIRMVDGQGRILSNGGRVMKNVTGYDLVKLASGSWGTLGALSEVSLKVQPIPEQEVTLQAKIPDLRRAMDALRAATKTPFEVTGASYTAGIVSLRVEGFEVQVKHRVEGLRSHLRDYGDWEIAERSPWSALSNLNQFDQHGFVWRFSVRPSKMEDLIERVMSCMRLEYVVDQGGAVLWAGLARNSVDVLREDGIQGLLEHAPVVARETGEGHVTVMAAPEAARQAGPIFMSEPPAVAALSNAIRSKFDPRGILNPGRMA